ncbi:hypothetical protein H8L32_03585 [Undibacterium sp. CY18W]|uniref:DUF3052 family protein n=1 Tax=Undibacterium hunanense TaxID=2762292 RepID=A0ABR6ZL10_9BURK|nr:hypothetical protein [Undibacterium hunanense]MBC3916558.1 hypothetical protein [Undibacterium hunanense]
MSAIFQKLNLKTQSDILVLQAPESFEPEIAALTGVRVHRNLSSIKQCEFSLAFVSKQKELDQLSLKLSKLARDDALLWFAYPKKTSRRYECEFNRDTGWDVLRAAGFDSVRMVAIDEDWSALRFRRVEYIKA